MLHFCNASPSGRELRRHRHSISLRRPPPPQQRADPEPSHRLFPSHHIPTLASPPLGRLRRCHNPRRRGRHLLPPLPPSPSEDDAGLCPRADGGGGGLLLGNIVENKRKTRNIVSSHVCVKHLWSQLGLLDAIQRVTDEDRSRLVTITSAETGNSTGS